MSEYKRGDERIMRVCDIDCGRVSWACEGEVVRCRDCANTFSVFDELWCNRNHNLDGECYMVDNDGFCAWAERREATDER